MIIVTGAYGMLGRSVLKTAEEQGHKTLALGHADMNIADGWTVFNWAQAWTAEDTLINCAGIPGDIADPWTMISANSLGPQILGRASREYGFNLIHVSTDCVFSGWDRFSSPHRRTEHVTPNPDTFYGRSKLAGEPWEHKTGKSGRVTVVRTSFVGPDHGLMRWVMDQERGAQPVGWRDAWWSGSTVTAVAQALVGNTFRSGVVHLGTEVPITKLQAITLIAEHLGRDDLTILSGGPKIDRSLDTLGTLRLPSLKEALADA